MDLRQKMDKEPIEMLLGLAGAVQYLEHTPKDDGTYWVWVKTRTGNRQIAIPIAAVQRIQFQKPDLLVVESIKRQLTDEPSGKADYVYTPIGEATQSNVSLWHRLMGVLGMRK
ncbi:hypothetical protein [Spirosoma gilvum]